MLRLSWFLSVEAASRDNGRTEKDMAWAWKLEADGYIEENGRKDLKAVMVSDSLTLQQQNMREHGRMVCRTDTDRKLTLTMVGLKEQQEYVYLERNCGMRTSLILQHRSEKKLVESKRSSHSLPFPHLHSCIVNT